MLLARLCDWPTEFFIVVHELVSNYRRAYSAGPSLRVGAVPGNIQNSCHWSKSIIWLTGDLADSDGDLPWSY